MAETRIIHGTPSVIARTRLQLGDVLDMLAEPALLLVLDSVQDPHILGACLRCAEAFGAHAVIAQQDRAIELDATAENDSYGAAEAVPYITVANLVQTLRELKKRDIWVVGMDGEAENDLHNFYHADALALVMDTEGKGLRDETKNVCDQLLSIPMRGRMENFDASISVGICLFEARSDRVTGVDHTQGFSVTG
jgi:23S rRNA (guanosine2251-2'-O)-methyltransferase